MAEVMVHADSQTEKKDKHLTKKDLWKVFWYSMGIESGCSVTKQWKCQEMCSRETPKI